MMDAPKLVWKSALETLEVELRVLTPVFGGGVHIDPDRPHQKDVDHRTPLRGAAVRGQLRFWWRASRGSLMQSAQEMLIRETEIWGNASHPGAVTLAVERQPIIGKGEAVHVVVEGQRGFQSRPAQGKESLVYGAFSLQPQDRHLKSHDPEVRAPGQLRHLLDAALLRLRFPAPLRADVEAAVAAWTSFGGTGGRTRRGFGAVARGTLDVDDLKALVRKEPSLIDLVPSLHGARLVLRPTDQATALDALQDGLRVLRDMRQGPGNGRNRGEGPRPGRSRWPEPELIRQLTGRTDPAHAKRFVNVDKMPRWRFGMPIVFHFQSRSDPGDTQLVPRGYERMASPLIIRPIKLPSGRYRCLALVLHVPGLDGVALDLRASATQWPVDGSLLPAEVACITPLRNKPDALSAFLDAFSKS